MNSGSYIVSAEKIRDGIGSTEKIDDIVERLKAENYRGATLKIDPLSEDWFSEIKEDHFRSGCAPVEALIHGSGLICEGKQDFVVIHGKDHLKSGYTRDERNRLMNIYGETIPSLYNELALLFINEHKISKERFIYLSEILFQNYSKTFQNKIPGKKWFDHVTELFRGVDCANPTVDFEGKILLSNERIKNEMNTKALKITGRGFSEIKDGRENLKGIKNFVHLKKAIDDSLSEAGIDFFKEFRKKNALMEVYTCYPVIPLAFLFMSGLIKDHNEIEKLLGDFEITVTGGMNLSKAPWNNPALNATIDIYHLIFRENKKYALIHGNGGLGYKQGIVIMEAEY